MKKRNAISYTDLGAELTDELEAMNGRLVGQLAAVLSHASKEEKVAALAVTVNYFRVCHGIDMVKFHALLELCKASEESESHTTGHSGPPAQA
jgi:hypothetical protein